MGATCPVETSPSSPSLFQNGNLVFQAHHVGWIVASFFAAIAVVTSFWLVNKHLRWYTNKREQRHIVRLLFMVPTYAVISLASYFFWNHATPLLLIRDAYESTVLTAFFYLLLTYLSPNPEDQRTIFLKVGLSRAADAEAIAKGEDPKKWMFPLGFIKSKPADGLYFLQMMKWGVLQYCVIRPMTTLAAVILNYIGWYCDGSFNPRWGYVYITAIVSISVSIAMYCLIQLYIPIAPFLAPQKPLLKLFSVKAVVFLTFWQATFLSALSMFGVVKDTTYMTADDINIGIAALLETFEMMLFAFLHLKAFSYKPYQPYHDPKSKAPAPTPTPRLRSLANAFDFRETFREIHVGWIYIMDKLHGREPRPDMGARRIAHYESAFDRPRPSNLPTSKLVAEDDQNDAEKGLLSPSAAQSAMHDIPWLKLPNDSRREKSESLEAQIEKELERRGYGSHIPGRGHIGLPPDVDGIPTNKPQRSWWRSVYSRLSQSANDPEEEQHLASRPSRRKKSQSKSRQRSRDLEADRRLLAEHDYNFEDPPPPSVFKKHRSRHRQESRPPREEHLDTLAPLSVFTTHRAPHQVRPPKSKARSSSNPTPGHAALQDDIDVPPSHSQPLPRIIYSQTPLQSSDSLLGRVFPPTATNSSVDHAPASDSERSLPSVSTHGVSPSRATPGGRLVPAVPWILGKEPLNLNHSGARVTPAPQQAVVARSVEALPSDEPELAVQPKEWAPRGSHSRESALHRADDKPPALTLNTTPDGLITSPLSAEFGGHFGRDLSQRAPRPSAGLRRKSAQVYSPDSPSRRGRRQSAEVYPPQMPKTSYIRPTHTSREQRTHSSRRMSAPLHAIPPSQYAPSHYEEELRRPGYSSDNMRSDIMQPSFSGTPQTFKYPTAVPSTLVMPASLATPGMPPPQVSNPLSYPRIAYPSDAGPSTSARSQPQIGERHTSRSNDYPMTRTTRP